MKERKQYDYKYITKEFSKLDHINQIRILTNAIDLMHANNNRSRFTCIALSMGYENPDGGLDTYMKKEQQ